MVTAGVYMIARLSFIFAISPTASAVVALVGGATALFAATIGIAQNDIKKVLAYSTVSQLGYMMIGVGVGAYFAGVFHLMTHAFFKACLFLGSGAVIHALEGEQDMRRMGGLRKKLPWTYMTFLISTIAIAGFPPLAGFFSKDEILWKAVSSTSKADWAGWVHVVAYAMGIMGAAITSFYMFRLVFMTFHGEQRSDIHVHHEMKVMSWPLAILAGLAFVGGWVNASLVGGHHFKHFLDPVVGSAQETAVTLTALAENHAAEWGFAGLSVLVAVIGLMVAHTLYLKKTEIPGQIVESAAGLHRLVFNKYYIDELYEMLVIKPIHFFSVILWKKIDVIVVDSVGVNGPPKLLRSLGGIGRLLQSGNAQAYAFWLFVGFAGLLGYVIYVAGLF
jgi:NADH-quinone oxidoreductase subunit L